jgi:hypothetical protein
LEGTPKQLVFPPNSDTPYAGLPLDLSDGPMAAEERAAGRLRTPTLSVTARVARSGPNVDRPVELANLVDGEWLGRGAGDHSAGRDVELGAVALACDRRAREQSS